MEFDLYEINQWEFPGWVGPTKISDNLYIDLSHNPHFMAANILYSNFELLDNSFASWFIVHEGTAFLYEKLKKKFKRNVIYNHQSEITYFHFTGKQDSLWKRRRTISRICETRPMCEITFPEEDLAWYYLAANSHKCVIEFLKQHRENINWAVLSQNSSDAAVEFLLEESSNIDWWNASGNTNEKIMAHFTEQRSKLSEYRLSKNPTNTAVQFLLDNADFYTTRSWVSFCKNSNDIAVDHIISIISENRNDARLVWSSICENTNPRVFDILRDNKDKIVWSNFLRNPICFSYDYEMMRKRCLPIKKEIEDIFLLPENVMLSIERSRNGDEDDFDVISRLNV